MKISETERAFIDLVRRIRFGRIESFRLVCGLPVVDDNTDICAEYRLSGVDSPGELLSDEEYAKKPQVRAMFERFHEAGDAVVESLDIRDGIPFRLIIKTSAL